MDEKAFAERVAQPLLLQAPLQAVLLDLFRQMQAQSAAISKLQQSLGVLDAREREGSTAARQAAEAASVQAQCAANALAVLDVQLADEREAAKQHRRETDERLQHLELRLHGASNLAGRQAALDDIASMLGIIVPELAHPHLDGAQTAGQNDGSGTAELANSFKRAARAGPAGSEATAFTADDWGVDGEGLNAGANSGDGSTAPKEAAGDEEEPEVGDEDEAAEPVGSAARSSTTLASGAGPHRAASGPPSSSGKGKLPASGSGHRRLSRSSVPGTSSAASPAAGISADADAPAGYGDGSGSAAISGASTRPGSGRAPSVGAAAGAAKPGSLSVAEDAAAVGSTADPEQDAAPGNNGSGSGKTDSLPAAARGSAAPQPQAPARTAGQRVEIPSPAALLAAMQAAKSKAAAAGTPARPGSAMPATAQRAVQSPASGTTVASRTVTEQLGSKEAGGSSGRAPGAMSRTSSVLHHTTSGSSKRVSTAVLGDKENEAEAEAALEAADGAARPKSAAGRRLAEVVNMLRKRTSLKETGLLWKLQASLAESVAEQERLQGELHALQEQLEAVQAASGSGLERCNQRIDRVEDMAAAAAEGSSLSTVRTITPRASAEELKALEERVSEIGSQMQAGTERLAALDVEVKVGAERLSRLEAHAEAEAAAAKLLRASSSGSREDTLAALQGQLLAQQQKLQAQMEALASGIRQGIPGQVNEAVTSGLVEVGKGLERKLSERLATRQDLQALSTKVTSKVTREEVERMLRAHNAALPPVGPEAGPAAGMRFRCISCDTNLQPFLFAAAPGALPHQFQQQYASAATADLRYSQLPVASPPRNASEPWAAAALGTTGSGGVAEGSRPATAGSGVTASMALPSAHVQLPPQQQALMSARPSTGASRLGAPVSWMHRMRRETAAGGSQEGNPTGSRRDSLSEHLLLHQPSLTAVGIGRPQTAATMVGTASNSTGGSVSGAGGTTDTPRPPQQQATAGDLALHEHDGSGADFYTAIREEPQLAGAASMSAVAAGGDGNELSPTSSARGSQGGGSTSKGALPALVPSTGGIKAVRPATALTTATTAPPADPAEGQPRSGSSCGKRRSTGMAGSTGL